MGAGAMTAARTASRRKGQTSAPKKGRVAAPRLHESVPASEPQPNRAPTNEPELILARVRLLARCRGAWLQSLWVTDGSIAGRATVTHAELSGILEDHDAPDAEAAWAEGQEVVRAWKAEAEALRVAIEGNADSRLAHLTRAFRLSREEIDLLQLCAAVAFEPSLGRACAYLQDHSGRPYMTEDLASRLLGLGRAGVWRPEMNVYRCELVQRREMGAGEPAALLCDPQIRDWLGGQSALDELLVGAARLSPPRGTPLPEWPVAEVGEWVRQSLRGPDPDPVRVVVVAPRGGGKRTFATAVAHDLGLPLIVIDADAADDANWPRFFLRAQRQAFLDSAAPAWAGESVARRAWPSNQELFPIQFVLCEPDAEPKPKIGTLERRVRLQVPDVATRERLWRESSPDAERWPEEELHRLAAHHSVWPGDIEHASRLGARTANDGARLVRETARARYGNLAQVLECPFTADDLVLPAGLQQILEAISFEAEERIAFWQQPEARRLFPQGRGLTALFSGPSGTGKTMAAQVIAAGLGQDLVRVNIAQLVSKWVGETSKNYEQVIRMAEENDAVLFFDEADALFAKRSAEIRDAQDKFANTDTAYLLQAIETYQGVAILATNLKSNIDPAFLRRLRYVVEFPKPDPALQRTLWAKLVGELAGEERARALAPALDLLSNAAEATGAQIKLALLAGLFAARAERRPLGAPHLLMGLDRELGKEGRAIAPRERERILKVEAGE